MRNGLELGEQRGPQHAGLMAGTSGGNILADGSSQLVHALLNRDGGGFGAPQGGSSCKSLMVHPLRRESA